MCTLIYDKIHCARPSVGMTITQVFLYIVALHGLFVCFSCRLLMNAWLKMEWIVMLRICGCKSPSFVDMRLNAGKSQHAKTTYSVR